MGLSIDHLAKGGYEISGIQEIKENRARFAAAHHRHAGAAGRRNGPRDPADARCADVSTATLSSHDLGGLKNAAEWRVSEMLGDG